MAGHRQCERGVDGAIRKVCKEARLAECADVTQRVRRIRIADESEISRAAAWDHGLRAVAAAEEPMERLVGEVALRRHAARRSHVDVAAFPTTPANAGRRIETRVRNRSHVESDDGALRTIEWRSER